MIYLYAALWIAAGVLSAGIFNGYFRGRFYRLISASAFRGVQTFADAENTAFSYFAQSILWGLFAPISLPLGFFLSGFCRYGLSYDRHSIP